MASQNPYEAPTPGYYQGPPPQKLAPVSGLAIASMVTGIIADGMVLLACCFGPTLLLAAPLGITAVVLAYFGRKEIREQQKEGSGFAIAGLACGWTAIGLSALLILAGVGYIAFVFYMASQSNP